MKYYVSPAAALDLDNIWLYGLEQWGLKQADHYQEKIIEMLIFLVENPTFGKNRDEINQGYTSYSVGSHVLFFSLEQEEIRVLRVLHKSMDFEQHFMN